MNNRQTDSDRPLYTKVSDLRTSGHVIRTTPELAFTAQAEVWRLVADHWYGARISVDRDVHKAAEKLMADIDDAIRDGIRAVSEMQEFE